MEKSRAAANYLTLVLSLKRKSHSRSSDDGNVLQVSMRFCLAVCATICLRHLELLS